MVDDRDGISALGSGTAIQSGSWRTGIVFIVRISVEHSVVAGSLYRDTGLVICDT